MIYKTRNITDRVAMGDDCFIIEQLDDGRVRLVPSPDSVVVEGTPINKALLQLIEDRVVLLMNAVFGENKGNSFYVDFSSVDGLEVEGVWNEELNRVEC